MGSHRNWTVRGYNVKDDFVRSIGTQLSQVPSAVKVVVRHERHAVETLLTHQTISEMSAVKNITTSKDHEQKIVGLYVRVRIPVTSYDQIRSRRSEIISTVHQWAEKARLTGHRGFRANAIKDPVIEKDASGDTYSLKFNVLFSNVLFYSSAVWQSGSLSSGNLKSDIDVLKAMLTKAIGYQIAVEYKEV